MIFSNDDEASDIVFAISTNRKNNVQIAICSTEGAIKSLVRY